MSEVDPRRAGRYLAICAAAIAFSITFALPAFVEMRTFWYYPLEHRWSFEVRPTGLAMDWFGRTLVAALAAVAVGVAIDAVARRARPASPRLCNLAIAWALTAAFLAMSAYAYQLAFRRPVAEPLPSWYQPR